MFAHIPIPVFAMIQVFPPRNQVADTTQGCISRFPGAGNLSENVAIHGVVVLTLTKLLRVEKI